jgi:lactate permease
MVAYSGKELLRAWTPWIILTVFVFIWGLPPVKAWLNHLFLAKFPMTGLHNLIEKVPPVVASPPRNRRLHAEPAVGHRHRHSVSGHRRRLRDGLQPAGHRQDLLRTLWLVRYSLLTIVLMLALGTLTRFSGTDTTLGLAFANTGVLYPSSAPDGLAGRGADRLGHRVQRAVRRHAEGGRRPAGPVPNLMGAANSSGGVMGKMIDAQSIVVASTPAGSTTKATSCATSSSTRWPWPAWWGCS